MTTATDPRADQWPKCWLRDGRKAYVVPSQRDPNVRYLVNTRACECPDFLRRGGPCKHMAAVRLHVARVRAEQAREGVTPAA